MKTLRVKVKGASPMLQHSGFLADPLYQGTKELKPLTSKRGKTEADLAKIEALEAKWGMYFDENGAITVDPSVIEGNLLRSATQAAGKGAKQEIAGGILAIENVNFGFDGPKDPDKRVSNAKYVFRAMVKVGTARIARCRPRFDNWTLEYDIIIDENVVDAEKVARIIEAGGARGLGDYRPRFGRYLVESVNELV
jgi:hypothetical protein